MSERVCPHCITLYNFLGEDDDGNAMYASTLLAGVHVYVNEGMGSTDLSNDPTRVHIFDDTAADEKPFVQFDEWSNASNKEQYWTLNPEGKDYFAIGDHRTTGNALPTEHTLFRITSIGRRQMGSRRMWHWRIEAR